MNDRVNGDDDDATSSLESSVDQQALTTSTITSTDHNNDIEQQQRQGGGSGAHGIDAKEFGPTDGVVSPEVYAEEHRLTSLLTPTDLDPPSPRRGDTKPATTRPAIPTRHTLVNRHRRGVDDGDAQPESMNIPKTRTRGSPESPRSISDTAGKVIARRVGKTQGSKIPARQGAEAIHESVMIDEPHDPNVVIVNDLQRPMVATVVQVLRNDVQPQDDTSLRGDSSQDEPQISTAYIVEDTAGRDQERIRELERTVQELRERETVLVYEPTSEESTPSTTTQSRSKSLVAGAGIVVALVITIVVISAIVVPGDSGPPTREPGTQVWYQMGNDIDGEAAEDFFGSSLAMSANGTFIAIGSHLNSNKSGHVRVYNWGDDVDEVWVQQGSDIDGEHGDESGRSVAMSADGKRIAIGAPSVNENAGHVQVYDWDAVAGDWVLVGGNIGGDKIGDESGRSVAISADGSRVAIGSDENPDAGVNAGHVRVFDWDEIVGDWIQVGGNINGEGAGDRSGYGVGLSASGDRLAVFAPRNTGNGDTAGHIRVFHIPTSRSGNWVQLGNDIDGTIRDQSRTWGGVVMSAIGDRIALGAPSSENEAGSVRVFDWDDNLEDWVQVGEDITGENEFDWSGKSLSMSSDGSRIAVGAPKNTNSTGHVRVYEYDEDSVDWIQVGVDVDGESPGDQSGWLVVMSANGKRFAVSARMNDGANGVDSGHVRVFEEDVLTD